ncbi:MAG: hypothetical protein L0323_10095 [Planctomycetes bacterium]|nr:hypothetical protein [Planctomycetota bacterium]
MKNPLLLFLPLLLPATAAAQACGPLTFVVTQTGPGCSPPVFPLPNPSLTVSVVPGPSSCTIQFFGPVLMIPHYMTLGVSNPALDLTPFGFPGCTLLTSLDIVDKLFPNPGSGALLTILLPQDPALIGATAYAQFFDVVAFTIALSNGLRIDIQ